MVYNLLPVNIGELCAVFTEVYLVLAVRFAQTFVGVSVVDLVVTWASVGSGTIWEIRGQVYSGNSRTI